MGTIVYPHLVVLALVLEGLGAAVGRGLAFLSGSGHSGGKSGHEALFLASDGFDFGHKRRYYK